MCVIAFSPKGVDAPTTEQIKKMWQHNPDGAGYAYVNRDGNVVYRKGFMKLNDLLKDLGDTERFKNTNFAIHFRIGTSGKNDGATCHPFPLSTTFGDLRKLEGECESVLFHNGILSDGGIASPLSSDTQDFVIAMTPLLYKFNRSKTRDHFIGELTQGSRLLILYKKNAFKMFGDWKKDGELWVSNLLYKDEYKWYGSGYYDYHLYDDYYLDDYYLDEYEDEVDKTIKSYNLPKEDEERVEKLWEEIIDKQYKWCDGIGDILLLKQSADSYNGNQIERGGYVLGYDAREFLVWLEDTPPLLNNINGKEN